MARQRRNPNRRGRSSYTRPLILPPFINGYRIEILDPQDRGVVRSLTPRLTVVPEAADNGAMDVQVEWRLAPPYNPYPNSPDFWAPEAVYTSLETGLGSGEVAFIYPPQPLTYRTWYYRLRAGDSATDTWGAWTPPTRYLDIQAVQGSVTADSPMNVGIAPVDRSMSASVYSDLNVGRAILTEVLQNAAYTEFNIGREMVTQIDLSAVYSDFNIGPILDYIQANIVYSDFNIVTGRPNPVIWWIRPQQGKHGVIFNIFGHGFGAFKEQYDGKVMLGNYECAISVWQVVPAEGEGPYEIVKGMGLESDSITAEHGWIVAIVPNGAVSADVKVILEGGA